MDFGEPFGGLMPGARGSVLAVLLRTGAPLTGRGVHALVSEGHSLGAVQQALRDLERLGLICTETVGRAGVHRIDEEHEAVASPRQLVSPLDMLTRVVARRARGTEAIVVFGSVARGEAHAASDVDLAVIAPVSCDGRVEFQEQVHARLGNTCDVIHLTADQMTADGGREPVAAEILRDGGVLSGRMPRRSDGSRSGNATQRACYHSV